MAVLARVTAALDAAIVRLRDADGTVVGAGFLVGPGEILTCSHVVGRALGQRDGDVPSPEAAVTVDFPLLAPDAALPARVVRWLPPRPDGGGDVAGLQLQSPPPAGAKALRLLTAPELWAHPFRTFGFPPRFDGGVWASGRLLSVEATGWVQLEDVKSVGFRVEPGFSGAPVWDEELGGVVGMAVAAGARPELRVAFMIPAASLLAAWPALERQTLAPCPYRGLSAFREQDAELFYGREQLAQRLVDQLQRHPVVGVIGPSGCGKSSLVFAGALPRLRRQHGWVVASMRPGAGASPLAALAAALLPLLEPEMTETQRFQEVRGLEAVLAEGRLAEVAGRAVERAGAERLLLVVDQFEEVFGKDRTTAREFVDLLVQALGVQSRPGQPRLVVVLTLRADFLGHALEHPGLAQAIQVRLIGRMTPAELREAIERPAAGQVSFEAGLVERILEDVGTEPGRLPLLEFALTLLWERQTDRVLSHAAYTSLGGVDGALARYAEQVYSESLAGLEEGEVRRLLVQLVRPAGDTTDHTRRVARRADLDQARWDTAQQLADTRLVVTGTDEYGEETVEVVHEALIAGWKRLRDWVKADRDFRLWQERVRAALAEWERSGHDAGTLLRGVTLAEAERWLEQRPFDISSLERSFVAASRAHQHRDVRRLRLAATVLATLLVLAVVLGVVAVLQGRRAEAQGRRAEAQSRRALSMYLLARSESQPDLSILLTVAADRLWPTPQTRAGLLAQLDRRRDASTLLAGHSAGVRTIAYSPDGRMLASAGADNTIRLWDPSRRTPAQVLGSQPDGASGVAFSPDGRTLAAAGGQGGTIRRWDVAARTELPGLAGPPGGTRALAFSPDGRSLVAGGNGGTISLLDAAGRRPAAALGQVRGVRQVAFSPDGRTVVAAGEEEPTIRRWRLPSRAPLPALGGHSDGVRAIAFSPDGRTLASAGIPEDGQILLWDLQRGAQAQPLTEGGISSTLAFSRDGTTLASASDDDRQTALWDVATRTRVRVLTGHTDTVTAAAFSPDGRTLATGSLDRTIALYDLTVPALAGHAGSVRNIAFSRDGRMLASAGEDRLVMVWDTARRIRLRVLKGHRDEVIGVAFSPDGRRIASAGYDGKVLLWELDRATPARELRPHPADVWRPAFSPSGRFLALPGGDGRVALWDLDRGTARTLAVHDGAVRSVAFSPDGALLASGGEDAKVVLWDVARGARVGVLTGHTGEVSGVAFSPDGTTLASAGGNVILWEVTRRSPVATLGSGIGVAFRPDGRTLAVVTSSADSPFDNSSIVLWDLADLTPYVTLERGIGAVFSPDGRVLATAGEGIVLRDLDEASWRGRLCELVGRELTRAEWADLVPGRSYQTVCR